MINPMDMTGKLILVTGASSGIGRNTSILLSRLGAKVILLARREKELQETMSMMDGSGHAYVAYDLMDYDGIENVISQMVQIHGRFDGLAYCAGISTSIPLVTIKEKFLHESMQLHIYSFIELVRTITKKKNFSEGGSIVALSTAATKRADKGKLPYIISKGALDSAVAPLAVELGRKKHIRVNSVNPGWVKTDMYYDYIEQLGEEKMNAITDEHLLGVAEPEEISNVIAFLLSPASSMITGQSLFVDSGWTIH